MGVEAEAQLGGDGDNWGRGALAVKPDAAETFWQRFLVNLPVSPKLRSRELVGLIWGRNPSRLAPAVKP